MTRLVFLLEESSMQVLLEGLLPRLFPQWVYGTDFLCVKHEGKSDLDKSIPRKLKAWRYPEDRFVVLRDSDGKDCHLLKQNLQQVCQEAGRADTLIRLVCQELESWYLGDLTALAEAFNNPKLDTPTLRKKYREPDEHRKPSRELQSLEKTFQKNTGARLMAQHLGLERNNSTSFKVFVEGIRCIKNAAKI